VRYIVAGLTGQLTNTATDKDGNPVMIAAFRTTGLPPHIAENVTNSATLIAQSIVNAITTQLTLIPNDEYAQLHQAQQDATGTTPKTITFSCPHNQPIIVIPGNRPNITLNTAQLQTLTAGPPNCTHCQAN
jgi:hypothetical protein